MFRVNICYYSYKRYKFKVMIDCRERVSYNRLIIFLDCFSFFSVPSKEYHIYCVASLHSRHAVLSTLQSINTNKFTFSCLKRTQYRLNQFFTKTANYLQVALKVTQFWKLAFIIYLVQKVFKHCLLWSLNLFFTHIVIPWRPFWHIQY